jgi:hypothetical protein
MTATRTTSTLNGAAAGAPRGPGVYVFLSDAGELLYIGKARDLRRRLADHARTPSRKTTKVGDVRWIECADEADALCLEADLVVALSPPSNATMAADSYEYVCLRVADGNAVTFSLTGAPSGRRVYGGFAHLGKGKVSWPAVRSKAGYSALLRLLWVAHADPVRSRIPTRLHGDSPPVRHEAPLAGETLPALSAFLSGRNRRLLESLAPALDSVPAFMRVGLTRDLEAAEQFYWLGPCRTRTLRMRHRLRAPVDEESFRRAIAQDLRGAIGTFVAPTQASGLELAGRRMARSIARREATQKRFS